MSAKFKLGDYVGIKLGIYDDLMEIVEIVDIDFIPEIDVEEFFIKKKNGVIFGPYKEWALETLINPNDIMKSLLWAEA